MNVLPMPRIRVHAVSVVLLLAVLAISCGDDNSDEAPASGSGHLGGHPPEYGSPVELTSGEYKSPAGYPEARELGSAAEQAEAGKPKMDGEIGGIELKPVNRNNLPEYCGEDDFLGFTETAEMMFEYLPPGTAALTPLYVSVCPDGSRPVIGQEFIGYNFTFEVFWFNHRVLLQDAPEQRVSATIVSDYPGVAIVPLTADGYGSSSISWSTPNGMISVTALDLPFDKVREIAEGVRCGSC